MNSVLVCVCVCVLCIVCCTNQNQAERLFGKKTQSKKKARDKVRCFCDSMSKPHFVAESMTKVGVISNLKL